MAGINNSELLFNSFLKTAENIVCHFDDDKGKRDEVLEELQEIVRKNCIHDEKAKNVANTVKDIIKAVDITSDSDEVLVLFQDKKKELLEYNPDVLDHSILTEYSRQIKDLVNSADGIAKPRLDDDDIEMTQDNINIIDPFTKRRMTDPVKNKVCGHVYDRESISSILKMNKNTRCPVIGCITKDPILMQNMIPDIVTRRFLHDNP